MDSLSVTSKATRWSFPPAFSASPWSSVAFAGFLDAAMMMLEGDCSNCLTISRPMPRLALRIEREFDPEGIGRRYVPGNEPHVFSSHVRCCSRLSACSLL